MNASHVATHVAEVATPMHDNESRLAALHSARAGLSTDDRSNFTHTMLGTLAYYVDDDTWMRALEVATEILGDDIERRRA